MPLKITQSTNAYYSQLISRLKDTEYSSYLDSDGILLFKSVDKAHLSMLAEALSLANGKRIDIFCFDSIWDFRRWKKEYSQIEVKSLRISRDNEIKINEVVEFLITNGFEKVNRVWEPGEFSLLGDSLIVWQNNERHPFRISFWGNRIESLELIDSSTRKKLRNFQNIEIGGTAEKIINKGIQGKRSSGLRNVNTTKLNEDSSVFTTARSYKLKVIVGSSVDSDYHDASIKQQGHPSSQHSRPLYYCCIDNLEDLEGYKLFDFGISTIPGVDFVRSNHNALFNILRSYIVQGYSLLWNGSSVSYKDEFVKLLPELSIESSQNYHQETNIIVNKPQKGLVDSHSKLIMVTDYELEGRIELESLSDELSDERNQLKIGNEALSTISIGDYIVHEDHGIGQYESLTSRDGVTYIVLKYTGEDRLYIPLSQVIKLSRYIGSGRKKPELTRLNGGSWRRVKAKAKLDADLIAKELLQIYALRDSAETSSVFTIDENYTRIIDFNNFVESFPYHDTDDQKSATLDIVSDLSKNKPMDRLLVGDVGFGKTEIAIRAAFAIMNSGKQVALLAPTTILVEQHKEVIKKRLEQYYKFVKESHPKEFNNIKKFTIASLSRFLSKPEINSTIQSLEDGTIDLVVGTHSLLSDAVKFKNLGLVIIDEEQRFGVKHKEKIKLKRVECNVLTMSATPIPRTLNMALSGIREISVIATPPHNRKPIINKVSEFTWEQVEKAIHFEKNRKGQVYYLHNKVADIEKIALYILEKMPDINVEVAHGQMSVMRLASVMNKFAAGEIDVLVATTIIENGLDLPNVNTLIVDDIDRLGLAQLYQIRGRIGRSDRQAYAYIMHKTLRGKANLRLEAMKEFHELGAGFQLSNRDLEIRGAGSLLGEDQSGVIDNVGYGLYIRLLSEAVKRLRRTEPDDSKSVKHSQKIVEHIWLR